MIGYVTLLYDCSIHANNQNNIIRSIMRNYYILTILMILTLLILRFDLL